MTVMNWLNSASNNRRLLVTRSVLDDDGEERRKVRRVLEMTTNSFTGDVVYGEATPCRAPSDVLEVSTMAYAMSEVGDGNSPMAYVEWMDRAFSVRPLFDVGGIGWMGTGSKFREYYSDYMLPAKDQARGRSRKCRAAQVDWLKLSDDCSYIINGLSLISRHELGDEEFTKRLYRFALDAGADGYIYSHAVHPTIVEEAMWWRTNDDPWPVSIDKAMLKQLAISAFAPSSDRASASSVGRPLTKEDRERLDLCSCGCEDGEADYDELDDWATLDPDY